MRIRKEGKRKMLKKIIGFGGGSGGFLTLAGSGVAYKNVSVIRSNIISAIANKGWTI